MIQATQQTVRRVQNIASDLEALGSSGQPEAVRLLNTIETFLPLVENVIRQARTRVLEGQQVNASQ
jgi:transposase, IS5 family